MRSNRLASTIVFALSTILTAADVLAVTASEYAVVINLSGRQRMLTQKMSKEMLMVAKGIDADANRQSLAKTAALFDSTLRGLKDGSSEAGLPPTEVPIIRKQLDKVDRLWQAFSAVVQPVIEGGAVDVPKVAELNLPLLKNMNTAVRLYEKQAKKLTGKTAGIVINLAGKQRMLTQKMSKEIMLVALQHDTDENKSNTRSTSSLFDRTLKGLKDGDADLELPRTDDPAIRQQLDKVAELWASFKPLVTRAGAVDSSALNNAELQQVGKLNLPLLKEMNKAVKMYEKAEQ